MSDGRPKRDLPVWKKLLLSLLVTVAFFVVVEVVLAVAGVEPASYADDPYVGFTGASPLFVESTGPDGRTWLETASGKLTLFNQQRFLLEKESGTFRVFCVGGSTTFGRPYDDATSFCGWLREMLPVADPSRQWEVVNAGGVSYASYRVAKLMEELAGYEPDLFVVYTGHNEFLERRSYPQIIAMPEAVRGVAAVAARTRTYTAVRSVVDGVRGGRSADRDVDVLEEEVTTLLDEAIGPDAYTRDDELREKVLQHLRFNLARMVDIARSAGARTVLVTPASNLQHCTPFKSENRDGLAGRELEAWRQQAEAAARAFAERRPEEALKAAEAAVAIDPRHAHLQFMRGQILLALERFAEAEEALRTARDEDVCPLRALTSVRQIVLDVARSRDVPVVDFVALAEERSENGIPGQSMFLDHVHPVIEAHRDLAVALVDRLAASGMVGLAPSWGAEAVAQITERVESGLDPADHALALMKLAKVLGWAGKQQEGYLAAKRAAALNPEDSRIQYEAGLAAQLLGRTDEAIEHYRAAVRIQPDADLPHGNLGAALESQGRLAEAVEHYRLAVRHGINPKDVARNRNNLVDALAALAYEVYARNDAPAAVRYLREAHELAPANADVAGRLGTALLGAARYEEAAAVLRDAVRTAPGEARLHGRLAIALAMSGEIDEAVEAYRRALRIDPRVASAPDAPCVVLPRMGRPDLARILAERATAGR